MRISRQNNGLKFMALTLLLGVWASTAVALPKVFTQEGLITDADNRPIRGLHTISVRLYRNAADAQPFYQETHENVVFTQGRYAIAVGSINPLDWPDFTGNVWLGMSLNAGPELVPRIELGPVPGAFVAEVALQIVPGAVLDIGELAVNGQRVIDEDGHWVGPAIDAQRLDGFTADRFIRADSADTMGAELRFSDLIRPSGGGGGRNGIRWMDDEIGGFADSAWMQWVSADGEDTTLMIAVGDDPGDTIELRATGGIDVRGGMRVDGRPIPLPPAHLMTELSQVDGHGSGLDADRLDGLDATDFLRADGALNLAGDLRVGPHRITMGSAESESLIHQQRQQNGDDALVVQQRPGHSIRLGFGDDNDRHDAVVASVGSVAFNDVDVQINQRLFLDRNDSTLTLRRPDGQSRVGLNLNTGANRSWSIRIAENDAEAPNLRFFRDEQHFSEDTPQFDIRPTGDISVGRDAHIARNLSVDGALEVGGQPVAKDAPIGAIALHTERANAAMIANGYTPLYMKVSTESESQNGSWRRLADLPIAQEWATGATFNGRFYLMGFGSPCVFEYDPAMDRWRQRACHPEGGRYAMSAHAVGEYIYFMGGHWPHDYNHRYHPASDTWQDMSPLITSDGRPAGRAGGTGGVVDGYIYIAKGSVARGDARAMVRYDPRSDAWSVLARAQRGSTQQRSAVVGQYIYFAGGNTEGRGAPSPYMERYDTVSNTWQELPDVPEARGLAVFVGGPDGRLYYIGGTPSAGIICDGCDGWSAVFDPQTNQWSRIADAPIGSAFSAHAVVGDELIVAGGIGRGRSAYAYRFPRANYWLYRKSR